MDELNSIFKKYEGIGVPYRGRCDDISKIIKCLSEHFSQHNDVLNERLICELEQIKYIKSVEIKDDYCLVEYDQGRICFSTVPNRLKDKLRDTSFYDKKNNSYCFSAQCHSVTSKYLELCHSDNIKAVTSVCININNIKYFHSYIWDVSNNLIIDFARDIVMDKSYYDFLFVDKEINVLDYKEYLLYMNKFDYRHCGKDYCRLFYLALATLYEEEKGEKYRAEKTGKAFSYFFDFFDFFSRNFINRGL